MASGVQSNHFAAIAEAFPEAVGKVVRKTAFDLQAAMQAHIRANGQIDTGFLVNSVYVVTSEDNSYNSGGHADAFASVDAPREPTTAYVAVAANYGAYQNYGTRFQPARPFVEPAVDEVRPEFEAAMSAVEQYLKAVS